MTTDEILKEAALQDMREELASMQYTQKARAAAFPEFVPAWSEVQKAIDHYKLAIQHLEAGRRE